MEIRLESPVERVITREGRATGVALATAPSTTPRSSSRPSTRVGRSPSSSTRASSRPSSSTQIRRFRFQGTSAKVNFALDGIPKYPALGDRTDQYRGFTNIGPSMEYLERAFDDAKYGWYSKRPYLDTAIQSTVDPDMAPAGKAVMSCFVQYAPYHLKESDWDTEREGSRRHRPGDARIVLPGLRRPRAAARDPDARSTSSGPSASSEGNIFAGEFLAPQMWFMRPAIGWSNYRTPIDGYYQCGSGTHPGGCVMGAPGKLAAQAVLKDRERAAGSRAKTGGGNGAGAPANGRGGGGPR